MIDIRANLTETILEIGTSVTRDMVDLPDYQLRNQGGTWQILNMSMDFLDKLWKITGAAGGSATMPADQRDVRELIKRRMSLLSAKLDPQAEPVLLCYARKDSLQDGEYCVLQKDHKYEGHVGNRGSSWKGVVAS